MIFNFLPILVFVAPIKIAAVGLNFSDAKLPVDSNKIEQVFFNSDTSVKKYFEETSYGKVKVEGDTHIVNIDSNLIGGGCDYVLWKDLAIRQLETQKVDTLKYDNFSFFIPPSETCPWAGLGEQPGKYSWINIQDRTETDFLAAVAVHEIGHNMNMYHACATVCKKEGKIVPISDDCIFHEYGNEYDTMGISIGMPHQSAPNKIATGWLSDDSVQWVQKDGEYKLNPIEATDGVRALVVRRAPGDFLVLELRSKTGFDSVIPTPGVLVYLSVPGDYQCRGRLLDMHPKTASYFDEALKVDESFFDAQSNIKMTIKDLSSQQALVAVEGVIPVKSVSPSVQDLDFYEAPGCSFSPTGKPSLFLILLVALLIRRKLVA